MMDFDHTLCSIDTLELFEKTYCNDLKLDEQIHEITMRIANGDMNIRLGNYLKFQMIKPLKFQLQEFGKYIANSFIQQDRIDFVSKMRQRDNVDIVIVSSGVKDIIQPSANKLDLDLFCIDLTYDHNDMYTGFVGNGFHVFKHVGIKMNIDTSIYDRTIMIGDGNNDYKVYLNNACDEYICYIEWVEWDFTKSIENKKVKNLSELEEYIVQMIAS